MPNSAPSSSLPSSWIHTTLGSIWAEMNTPGFRRVHPREGLQPQRGDLLRSPDQLTKTRLVSISRRKFILTA